MTPTKHARRGTPVLAPGALVACALLGSTLLAGTQGCALIVPKSWRVGAPVPLAGPIHANDALERDLSEVTTEELQAKVDADQRRLIELAADTESEAIVEYRIEEARDIAARLPALQAELDARGVYPPNARARHPTIR